MAYKTDIDDTKGLRRVAAVLEKYWWLFFLGSMLGSVVETFWCLLKCGYVEMRTSTVIGWFIPVYGIGAVVMTLVLGRIYDKSDGLIALISGILGGAVEYLCSLFQELIFGTVSWDYSNTKFNLNGRTNLSFCLMWALLGLLWVKEIYPRFSAFMDRRKPKTVHLWTKITAIFLTLNLLLSGVCVIRMERRGQGIPPANVCESLIDRVFPDEVMNFFYPNMKSTETDT
ncbi:MAG: putative ABC transporter permease [Eubacteriales bacterium]